MAQRQLLDQGDYMQRKTKAVAQFMLSYQAISIKSQARAMAKWRFYALVMKYALDRREKLFLVNNAKLEVQRNKSALSNLYR